MEARKPSEKAKRRNFRKWLRELEEDVIQRDYGYEPGEFTVYPALWRSSFREGLTPAQAFRGALDAYKKAREDEEAAKAANWKRIQEADEKYRTDPTHD